MRTVTYFAYGSNMLSARLRARCPSARARGPASVTGWRIAFSKPSLDGSGKATLARVKNDSARIFGVLYDIAAADMPALDRVEEKGVGYDRTDEFNVVCMTRNSVFSHTTYIARAPVAGLKPYDWYLALVIAGAREHGLDENYIATLLRVSCAPDPHPERGRRRDALRALGEAGHDSPAAVLADL